MDERQEIISELADILGGCFGCESIVADILGEVCSLPELREILKILESIERK